MRNWRVAEGMLWDELPKDKSLDDRVPNHSPRWRRNAAVLCAFAAAMNALACAVFPDFSQRLTPVIDDFTDASFSANWYVCHRDENAFAIVTAPGKSFNAAQMTVNRRPDLGLFALARHGGCRPEDGGPYEPGKIEERAELWEADGLKPPFGTEVWYRFDMWIGPTISTNDDNRLVIGQWKEDGGHSPMVAQRFVDQRFTITVEQDNNDPASVAAGNTDCRVYVAHDASFAAAAAAGGEAPDRMASILRADGKFFTGSVAHDPQDVIHPLPNALDASPPPCAARDITWKTHNLLPDVFDKWTKMVYHIKAATDASGILEVWANDQPIVTVRGRFGFRDHQSDGQYFKFGPYRNHVTYSTVVMLAHYVRGPNREGVDRP
jgi:hypothetical protein